MRWSGPAALSGPSRCAVHPSTLYSQCRTMGSSMILPTSKHTMYAQSTSVSEAAKSPVMHNSARLCCAQTGSSLPTEFSNSCDVDVSQSDSQSAVECPPLATSSHVSHRSAPSVSAASSWGVGVGSGRCRWWWWLYLVVWWPCMGWVEVKTSCITALGSDTIGAKR